MTFITFDDKQGEHYLMGYKSPMADEDDPKYRSEVAKIISRQQIVNTQFLIISYTGGGKSVTKEQLVDFHIEFGYKIIDVVGKDGNEFDSGFRMFLPYNEEQIEMLKNSDITPKCHEVTFMHPFVFDDETLNQKSTLRSGKRIKTEFYTYSVKDVSENAWGVLFGVEPDSDVVELTKNIVEELKNNEGIHELSFRLEQAVNQYSKKADEIRIGDSKDFYQPKTYLGDERSKKRIMNFVKKLRSYYFIQPNNCSYNIDFKKIMNNRSVSHVFVRDLMDKKQNKNIFYFEIMCFLEILTKTLDNFDSMKAPLCLIFEEIRILLPAVGKSLAEKIIAKKIKEILSQIRDKKKGATTIGTSQYRNDTDDDYANSCDTVLMGKLAPSDKKIMFKDFSFKFGTERMKKIEKLRTGKFMLWDSPDYIITIFPPSHAMKMEGENFIEVCKEKRPELFVSHNEVYEYFFKDRVERDEAMKVKMLSIVERLKKERMEKEITKEEKKVTPDLYKIKLQEKISEEKKNLMRRCYEAAKENPEMSWRGLTKKILEIKTHETIKKNALQYAEEIGDSEFILSRKGK